MWNRAILGLLLVVSVGFFMFTEQLNNRLCSLELVRFYRDEPIPARNAVEIKARIFKDYVAKDFEKLRSGVDKNSNEVLDFALNCMLYRAYFFGNEWIKFDFNTPAYHIRYLKQWKQEQSTIRGKYRLPSNYSILSEVFFFHHSLRFADKRILEYIKNKDIIDCGACIGDSLLVLKDYTNKTVYCYEFEPDTIKEFRNTVKNNNVANYKLIPRALGEEVSQMRIRLGGGQELMPGDDKTIDITTIDAEAAKEKFTVGFIKMDLEGYALKAIKGAIETIKRDRPVLSIGIYHNNEELFGVKPYLEENLENYVYEFKLQHFIPKDFGEMILFAYPKEIVEK